MQIHIETEDQLERERIIQRLLYSLNARREDIDSIRLSLRPVHDALGARLYRCQLQATLRDRSVIEQDETLSNGDLAVSRALERCARTAQRRLFRPGQRRII
jgi:hypothetical protein